MVQMTHGFKQATQWTGSDHYMMGLIAFLITVLLAGCAKSVPPPKYNFNPSPQEWYLVTVRSNQSIPKKVSVRVQYEIKNTKCIPIDYARALGGIRLNYPVRLHPEIIHVSRKEFDVRVAEDKILPGNYWDRGVCKWTIIAVIALYDGEPMRRSGGFKYKLSDPDRDSYLYGKDLRKGGWSVSGCVPTSGLATYSCSLFGYSSKTHGGELSVQPPRSDLDYQMFWMKSRILKK